MLHKSSQWLITILLLFAFVMPAHAAPFVDEMNGTALQNAPKQQWARPASPSPTRLTTRAPKANAQRNQPAPRVIGETNPGGTEQAIYIVQLSGAPLASYRGGLANLPATSPAVTGRRLDLRSAEARAYLDHLSQEQRAALDVIQQILGRAVDCISR